jgi:GntR family transcriptional repressor for pyruvate dehydrogenase complex
MSSVPKDILEEPMELRMIMEPNIASLAAKRADSNDIKILEECIDRQAKKVRENKIAIEEDSAFHFAVAKAANNSMLLVMVEILHELLKSSRSVSHADSVASKNSLDSHIKILEAIKNHDAEKAYDLMREHLLRVERLITINNE